MKSNLLVITIDGPAGAGKSTVARRLAQTLGWTYLDTGAMYRAVALAALEAEIDIDNPADVAGVLNSMVLTVSPDPNGTKIILGSRDVTAEIRQPIISSMASTLAIQSQVREKMYHIQRTMGQAGQVVVEGRDMGTVVFPDAFLKIFLDASPEKRSQRRHLELRQAGIGVSLEDVMATMAARDHNDSTRVLSPLKPADDAVFIDSTGLDVEGVLEKILTELEKKDIAIKRNY